MEKIRLLLILALVQISPLLAQESKLSDSSIIVSVNRQIDNLVVDHNIIELDKLYATDFVFSHGSGRIEGKESWFKSVSKGSFVSRQHDSVTVEMHQGIAIVRGNLSVKKKSNDQLSLYHLKYIRVYVNRDDRWQLISHITTAEWHEPD